MISGVVEREKAARHRQSERFGSVRRDSGSSLLVTELCRASSTADPDDGIQSLAGNASVTRSVAMTPSTGDLPSGIIAAVCASIYSTKSHLDQPIRSRFPSQAVHTRFDQWAPFRMHRVIPCICDGIACVTMCHPRRFLATAHSRHRAHGTSMTHVYLQGGIIHSWGLHGMHAVLSLAILNDSGPVSYTHLTLPTNREV